MNRDLKKNGQVLYREFHAAPEFARPADCRPRQPGRQDPLQQEAGPSSFLINLERWEGQALEANFANLFKIKI